jgi:hypothetical protein
VGLNLGLDRERWGFEAMTSDAADPQLFGTRLYFRPWGTGFPLSLGLTGATDLNPERVPYGAPGVYGQPVFLNFGLGAELPVARTKALSVILFADAASMLPYLREAILANSIEPGFPANTIEAGWQWDAVLYGGSPKNWGAMAGLLGNVFFLDYRLEYRYSVGTFHPGFYGPLYDRLSTAYVADLVHYLDNPSNPAYDVTSMGIYGELGFTLEKVFYIAGGYFWPWPVDPVSATIWPEDTLHFELGIFKGLLPLYGSVALDRVGIFSQLKNTGSISFFDKDLLLSGEIVYPLSPILDLALQVTSSVVDGSWYPSFSILTRIGSQAAE